MKLSAQELKLLDLLQEGLPLEIHPYSIIAEKLRISEDEIITSIKEMIGSGIVRRIGASCSPREAGLTSTLCAAIVRPEKINQTAELINTFPEVTHNYGRKDRTNLWFTVITPYKEKIASILQQVENMPGVESVYNLPMVRQFKLHVRFPMHPHSSFPREEHPAQAVPVQLDSQLITIISSLQKNFPIVKNPYHFLAGKHSLETERFIALLHRLRASGILRRIAGFINHNMTPYSVHAMAVFELPGDEIETAGNLLARGEFVSHCYQRRAFPDWPYQIYAMMHEKSLETLGTHIKVLLKDIPVIQYKLLTTEKEYKKSSWIMDELYEKK